MTEQDIQKMKEGWPIECLLAGRTPGGQWTSASFIGIRSNGAVVLELPNGAVLSSCPTSSLRLAKKKMKGWINIYAPMDYSTCPARVQGGHVFGTKEQADQFAEVGKGRIACVEIEWEENYRNK